MTRWGAWKRDARRSLVLRHAFSLYFFNRELKLDCGRKFIVCEPPRLDLGLVKWWLVNVLTSYHAGFLFALGTFAVLALRSTTWSVTTYSRLSSFCSLMFRQLDRFEVEGLSTALLGASNCSYWQPQRSRCVQAGAAR